MPPFFYAPATTTKSRQATGRKGNDMTLKYVGGRQFKDRLAEFTYTDDEEERFDKIAEYLRHAGYEIDVGVMNWAAIRVEDKAEFDAVMEDWKKAKKLIR